MGKEISLKKIKQDQALNSALKNGIIGVFVYGILALLNNSVDTAVIKGIVFGIIIFFLRLLIGKLSWNKSKKKSKLKKYDELNELGFIFNDNLYFEGVFRAFLIRIIPYSMKKNNRLTEYDVIQVFYQSKSKKADDKDEPEIIKYYLGELLFYDKCVCFVPKDNVNTNFIENLEGIINILSREEYKTIT